MVVADDGTRMDTVDDELTTGPPPPALAGYTGYLLRRAFERARASGARAMLPGGRAPQDLGLLVTIQAAGPLSQRKLGQLLGLNRTTMVALVDRLEADGLVTRGRDPVDQRNYALTTTAEGRAAIAELMRTARRGDAELTTALTQAERVRLVELLGRVVPDLVALVPRELSGLSGFLIARAYLRIRAEVAEPLIELGIAPQHFGMLTALAAIEPCSQQRLANELGVSGPTVVVRVAALEDRSLISRERNPDDRREHLLKLTPAGRKALTAAIASVDHVHERLSSQVGTTDLAELNALLTKIAT
jgi:DNA-binding MarR family transcriptional regulator